MKRHIAAIILFTLSLGIATVQADSIGLYGTYWDGDLKDEGDGIGVKIKKDYGIFAGDLRLSKVDFEEADIIPIEATLLLRVPFIIQPYAGLGAGYYYADSDELKSGFGWYGAAGLEIHVLMLGVFGEIRQVYLEEDRLDGPVGQLGLLLNW